MVVSPKTRLDTLTVPAAWSKLEVLVVLRPPDSFFDNQMVVASRVPPPMEKEPLTAGPLLEVVVLPPREISSSVIRASIDPSKRLKWEVPTPVPPAAFWPIVIFVMRLVPS